MVRLFVGGLSETTTATLLKQRFMTFGKVVDCEIIPPKPESTLVSPAASCRGFAFVDLEATDDSAIKRCVNAYNNSTWRGHTLKVQPAKQNFLQVWKQEREQLLKEEEEERKKQQLDAVTQKTCHRAALSDKKDFTFTTPQGKSIVARANKRKTHFPAAEEKKLMQLSWSSLPPTQAILRKEAFVIQMQKSHRKQKKPKQTKPEKDMEAIESQTSEELEAVDFFDDPAEVTVPELDGLGRFDDNEESQEERGVVALQHQQISKHPTKGIGGKVVELKSNDTKQQPDSNAAALLRISADIWKRPQKLDTLSSMGDSAKREEGHCSRGNDNDSQQLTDCPNSSISSRLRINDEEICEKTASDATSSGSQSLLLQQKTVDGTREGTIAKALSDGDEGPNLHPCDSTENIDVTFSDTDFEAANLTALLEELKAGATFWNGHPDSVDLEASWLANREQMAANAKKKRKQALKMLMAHSKKKF